jgi:lysophospholipase L1-like esterase
MSLFSMFAQLRSRRRAAGLTAVLAVLLSLALAAPTASADSAHRGRPGFGYLALGDSVPFGFRPAQVTPPSEYLDASNFTGYPELIAGRTGLVLANASCPGETTASLIDENAQSNGCENSVGSPFGYRDAFPLHVAYPGSQLDFAVSYLRSHPHTRLVTLMVGANDLFICQRTTADQCTGSDFRVTVDRVEKNVDTILSTLRARAHYHHRLVLVTYYSLDYRDPVGTGSVQLLNAALGRAAEANGAVVADGFGAFRQGAAATGGDTCEAHLVISLPAGGCDVHPTRQGHELLADAVLQAAGSSRGR